METRRIIVIKTTQWRWKIQRFVKRYKERGICPKRKILREINAYLWWQPKPAHRHYVTKSREVSSIPPLSVDREFRDYAPRIGIIGV